ncbi:MAG: type I-C CRISPR-associated protein Cas8c/Csd1 [Subdoligranulum variabile]|uniref:type I-C CRISPR-associated protein Cas8c/Csd1 n=1 Tax=uncultured Subdoligranulum sp. TaxID=512298 RepID=UPI000D795F70|nr:type I-C CRISPR-associated protein Cas8c/Csd1 [uncultured Subdoligranulum sp.]PWM55851.1 MAG: type I-C CRISPR-associated protein Cas8c/Csd1 [Subdoligranulum variabile]
MILQALTQCYEDLLAQGKADRPGWSQARVSYGLVLNADGELTQLLHLQQEEPRGKKTVLVPQSLLVPSPVKRSSGPRANFLCDNSSYLLGVDAKGKPTRTAECFAAAQTLHRELLQDADTPAARAVLRFFETWAPTQAADLPVLQEDWEDLLKGGNLVFWYNNAPVTQDPVIANAWTQHYESSDQDAEPVRCLVTGRQGPLARLHPAIKGVAGAQSVGASLVSFNAQSFCSYDHEQGANAPVSEYAAFAYTTALNALLADRDHVKRVGDTTILCWASGGETAYQDCFLAGLFNDSYTEKDILNVFHTLAKGEPVDWQEHRLDPATRFYVLGLAPNAARLSVRFFWQNTFGTLARNVAKHYKELEIIRPSYDKFATLPIWRLVQETVRKPAPGARPPEPNPRLAGDLLLCVLNGTRYPATLLDGVVLRIRAEHNVSRGQAAITKAYYLRNSQNAQIKEVMTMQLNEQSTYLPYVLGRLFAVLEGLQQSANPGINTTIKDRYFNSASATPATVFPLLINLAQKHLGKLDGGLAKYYNEKITELNGRITQTLPARMSLPEQSAFQIGYYHETQARYTAKNKKEEQ